MVMAVLVAMGLVALAVEMIPLAASVVEGLVVEEIAAATIVVVATTIRHQ
jgi:hypothetical protein